MEGMGFALKEERNQCLAFSVSFYFQAEASPAASSALAPASSLPNLGGSDPSLDFGGATDLIFCYVYCFSSLCLDLVTPSRIGFSGCSIGVVPTSNLLVCYFRSVKINVIFSDQFLIGKLLRRILCLSTRDEGWCVIGDCYLPRVLCLPTRVNILNHGSFPVILTVWFVSVLMIVCCKFGEDLEKMFYPNFDMLFSGQWRCSDYYSGELMSYRIGKICINFGLSAPLLLEEGFVLSLAHLKKIPPSCGSSFNDPNSPVCMQDVTVIVLLLPFNSPVMDSGFGLQDSGYEWKSLCHFR